MVFASHNGNTTIIDLLVKNGAKAIVTPNVKAAWFKAASSGDLKTIRDYTERYDKSILELKNESVINFLEWI